MASRKRTPPRQRVRYDGEVYGRIASRLWKMPEWNELATESSLLFTYVLTGDHRNEVPGLWHSFSPSLMWAERHSWDRNTFDLSIEQLEREGWLEWDPRTAVIWVPIVIQWFPPTASQDTAKGIGRMVRKVPDCDVKTKAIDVMFRAFRDADERAGISFLNAIKGDPPRDPPPDPRGDRESQSQRESKRERESESQSTPRATATTRSDTLALYSVEQTSPLDFACASDWERDYSKRDHRPHDQCMAEDLELRESFKAAYKAVSGKRCPIDFDKKADGNAPHAMTTFDAMICYFCPVSSDEALFEERRLWVSRLGATIATYWPDQADMTALINQCLGPLLWKERPFSGLPAIPPLVQRTGARKGSATPPRYVQEDDGPPSEEIPGFRRLG